MFILNHMQCGDGPGRGGEEAGAAAAAAADILLSRWKQNLNWGMAKLNSRNQHDKDKPSPPPSS